MKSRSTILVGILLCLSLFVVGNLGSPALATDETPLEDAMSGIKSKLRKVKRALRAEDVTAALEGMQALEEAALAAKKFEPKMVMEEKDEAKKAALMKDFRLRVIALIGEMLKIEKVLLAGDIGAANAGVATLQKMNKSGHERFGVDEDW